MKYFTEAEMLQKETLFAIVCLGGMAEGFDYSEAKTLMKYWAKARRDTAYQGGYVADPTAAEAKRLLEGDEE